MQGKAAGCVFNLCFDQPGREKDVLAVDLRAVYPFSKILRANIDEFVKSQKLLTN
jgi:hypothetical protein